MGHLILKNDTGYIIKEGILKCSVKKPRANLFHL